VACGGPRRTGQRRGTPDPAAGTFRTESSDGPLLSGVDRSAGLAVKARRLHEGERCGGDEHLDVGCGKYPVYFAMMGAAALGDGVEVSLDSGPGVLPYPELSSCRSSMIRKVRSRCSASSDRTLSAIAPGLKPGVAASGPPSPGPPCACRMALRTASQNCWVSCSLRWT
jgi:hypothetical protein